MLTLSALTILPLSVTIIGAALAIVIFNHYFTTRRRPHELVWSIAFVLFAVAAATQVLADAGHGWTPLLGRIYYIAGAVLNVALLGLGTIYLLFNRRVATVALVLTLVFAAISIFVLFSTHVNTAALTQTQAITWSEVFAPSKAPSYLAAIGSGVGSVIVIVGALWSGFNFLRKGIMKNRMIGVFLLAIGTFVVAAGGTLKGLFSNDHLLYPTMAIGVVIMFVGYLQTIRPSTAPQPAAPQPAPGRSSTV